MWLMLRLLILESGSFDVGFVDFVCLMIKLMVNENYSIFVSFQYYHRLSFRSSTKSLQDFTKFSFRKDTLRLVVY